MQSLLNPGDRIGEIRGIRPHFIGMSHEQAVERARAFIPVLRARSAEAEEDRGLPLSTYEEFRAAGFYRLAQPVSYGGVGLDMDTVNEVCFELARGDPSAAWVAGFYAIHNHMIGMHDKEGQEEYWSTNFDQNMATASSMVRCEFEDVERGVIVSGEWDFVSGVNHAEWVQVYRVKPDGLEGLLIPRNDCEIIDNWWTAGGRATASNRIRLESVFVPRRRVMDLAGPSAGQSHGRPLYGTRYYKLPIFTFEGMIVSYIIVGGAQGLLDVFQQAAVKRKEISTGERYVDRASNQVRLAESAAEIDAALEILLADQRRLNAWADADYEPTLLERARVRRNSTFAVKLALRSAHRLYDVSGAHAIYDKSPIQRFYRDITALSHAPAALWDPSAEQYARIAWGLPPTTAMF